MSGPSVAKIWSDHLYPCIPPCPGRPASWIESRLPGGGSSFRSRRGYNTYQLSFSAEQSAVRWI